MWQGSHTVAWSQAPAKTFVGVFFCGVPARPYLRHIPRPTIVSHRFSTAMYRLLTLVFLAPLLVANAGHAQSSDTIRVCTYNLLNYGQTVDPTRVLSFQDVLGSIRPALLVVQEMEGEMGLQLFARDALATTPWLVAGPFVDGPDSDNALFYDSSRIDVIDHAIIATPLRNVDRWRLVVRASRDTVDVWGLHLKAGDADTDAVQRGVEASLVRASLDSSENVHRIVAGDLNVYTSTETAYFNLTYSGIRPAGEVMDPIGRVGEWHNSAEYADVHTQSTRGRQFGGGANGGMDDRFDWLLISGSLFARYREGSYTTYGNDGKHFNDSINAQPNTAVDPDIAQSLHDASDHLPVYFDLIFTRAASGVRSRDEWIDRLDLSDVPR